MIIKFTYLEKYYDCHKDFQIEFVGADKMQIADTYYFATELGKEDEMIDYLKNYINDCKEIVVNMNEGHYCIIPLDLSDQYIGALKISFTNSEYFAQYVFISDRSGYNWSDDFMKEHKVNVVLDLEIYVEREFTMTLEEILNSFKLNVVRMN